MKSVCVVLLIHGGGFVFGTPGALTSGDTIREAGYGTVDVAYPLGDVRRAYRAASAAVPRHQPTVAFGESAGGTIAAWMAAHRLVDAAVTVGAPTDLRRWPAEPRDRALIGLSTSPWRYSPARAYRGQRPLWAIHWTADPVVSFAHAAALRGGHVSILWGGGHTEVPLRVVRSTLSAACAAARAG